jgi:hypothetical protein
VRFRCDQCGYNETRNSTAPNRNKRTNLNACDKAKALVMSCSCKPTTEQTRPQISRQLA